MAYRKKLSVEEDLAKSIRKDNLSPRDKAYIAGMPARDARLVPWMISLIKDEYDLDAEPTAPWYDPYTYDRYTYVAAKGILFRKADGNGIVLLEMRDRQDNWPVLYEACCEPVSKEGMLEILSSETSGCLGFAVSPDTPRIVESER